MDTIIKIYLLTGLLLALTCPSNCDGESSSATVSASAQGSTSASPQNDISISSTTFLESTSALPPTDSSTSLTTVQLHTSAPPQTDSSTSPTTVQLHTSAPLQTDSSTSPTTVLLFTSAPPQTDSSTSPTSGQLSTSAPTDSAPTEAHRNNNVLSAELHIENYNFFRSDRTTTTPGNEVPDRTTLAVEDGTSQNTQREISTTSIENLSTEGAGSTVGSTTTDRVSSTSVASSSSTLAETTGTSSTSTIAATSTEETTRKAVTTPADLPGTSATLHGETTTRRSTMTTTNIMSPIPSDGPESSPSQGGESSGSSAATIPVNHQSTTAPAELTTSSRSTETFPSPDVTNPGDRGTTLLSDGYTSESPKSESSTGETGSCSYHHFMISVVLSVLFINLVFCALSSFCVYRIVTKHHFYSWDPPPIRYGSVDYGISMGRRNMGLDLSPETPDGIPPPPRTTHEQLQLKNRDSGIPIVITNEDGWCVPYSEDSGGTRGEERHGQEGTRKTNGDASNRADVDSRL